MEEKTPVEETKAKAVKKKAVKSPKKKSAYGMATVCAAAVIALIVGCVAGYFVPGLFARLTTSAGSGQTTIAADKLDSTILGKYSYKGKDVNISAADVFEQTGTKSSSQKEDGTYNVPAADGVLAFARNAILSDVASEQGISVSDEDMDAYAKQTINSNDYAQIASSYGMSEDEVKNLIKQSALIKKLHDSVIKTQTPEQPTAPTEPAEGQEATPTADYAKYIINLAKDEWDADGNKWKSADGAYASALSNYEITNDSATYEAAKAAYYVAYQQYTQASSEVSKEWTDYVNGILKDAHVEIYNLVS